MEIRVKHGALTVKAGRAGIPFAELAA